MAKLQKTIYFEKDVANFIEKYKEDNELSNFSTSLERLILSIMYNNPINMSHSSNIKEKEVIKKEEKQLPASILTMRQSMRD